MLPEGILNASIILDRIMSTKNIATLKDLTFSIIHFLLALRLSCPLPLDELEVDDLRDFSEFSDIS